MIQVSVIIIAVTAVAVGCALYLFFIVGEKRAIEQERKRQYWQAAVEKLPDWQGEFVLMHVQDGYNYLEIAARLGVPSDYVLAELAKAYATLRLNDLEDEPPALRRWYSWRAMLLARLIRQ